MADNSIETDMKSTSDVIRQGKDRATREVKQAMRDTARQQKHKAADGLAGFANALHRSADDLGEQNQTLGQYANIAAERLDRFSQTLRERDVDELIREAEDFARRQPTLFIGTAMAAGFLMARFLKSSQAASSFGRTTTTQSTDIGATGSYGGAGYGTAGVGNDTLQPGGSAI